MEEFLTDYVQMMAEAKELELNTQQVKQIVNRLEHEDAIWDTVDFYVHQAFDSILEEGI